MAGAALLGQYSLPLSLLCWPSRLARLSRRGRVVELGLVTGLTLLAVPRLVVGGHTAGLGGDIVYDFGAGPASAVQIRSGRLARTIALRAFRGPEFVTVPRLRPRATGSRAGRPEDRNSGPGILRRRRSPHARSS